MAATDWRKRGNDALAAGDFAEAARCYEQGVLASPQDAALRLNLGFVLLEQGQFAPAAERLRQALALRRPDDGCALHEVHYLLGRARAGLGQHVEAVASFEAALRAQPAFAEALEDGARSLHSLERHAEAAEWIQRLLALRPTYFNRLLLATELNASERHAEAAALLDALCVEEPTNADATLLRFSALIKTGRHAEALEETDRAIAVHGRSASLLANRSVPLERLGRCQEALDCIEQALALEPANRVALVNRCTVLTQLLRLPEAIQAGEEALKSLPEDAEVHLALSIALLMRGDLQRGWQEHEWRRRSAATRGKLLQLEGKRMWAGESLQGRTIFLHGEQGFGDNIQFVRYVQPIAQQAQSVVLIVPAALESLVARSLPANCRLLPQNSALPPIDFHCPLMTVPAIVGTTEDTIPSQVPYLHADAALLPAWRERLGNGTLNVGIAWAGNPKHTNDHNRSMPLASLRRLDAPGCRFVTVQPGLGEADRALLADWPSAIDLGSEVRSFDETAALIEALDLVITVDTSIAHLAGALGKPVWMMLAHVPDWRWMLERSDSPWYPSARLYRQPAPRDWASVVDSVRRDLLALCAAR
ncbi:tetratricopeptide repeat protein [Ramlibacter ginsenosidimutans]|uniref:Tetratricopeptide repeat protein n=1 Tax=Ramlibacter ginsenosidimutans TaxID=502333 RepID=A0A934WKH9_9BURK|nr:tetratricopeptide repeat protein [Ramlibacter ginsenosidimutans]